MTSEHGDLTGKTALVTGASGTIGAAIVTLLAARGAKVAAQYNTKPPESKNSSHLEVQADLSSAGFEAELLDKVNQHLGIPDILVNNAAMQDVAMLAASDLAEFRRMQAVNIDAAFTLSREFASRQTGPAAIINISSIEATRPASGHGAYAISKAALEMLTRSMALEFGPAGLRVNAIAPGLIAREGIEQDWPEGVARWEKSCPAGRMGHPSEIAEAVAFLASDAAGFINGTILTIDGGMSVVPGW